MATRFFSPPLGFVLDPSWPRYTYLNFERYGQKNDLTYRNHHESGFSFRDFNRRLIEKHTGSRRMIAFGPSYIPKSCKRTPGVGYFWSGCASRAKWGLELCGFAAMDIAANTALHYFAAQTLLEDGPGLMSFYCGLLRQQAPELLKMSPYLGADAFFSKKSFVDTAIESGLDVITRLRDDAVLHYAPPPKKEGQKGRPKKYGDRFWPETQMPKNCPASPKLKGSAFTREWYMSSRSSAWSRSPLFMN